MKFDDLCKVQYIQLSINYVVIKIRLNFKLSIVGMSKLLVLLF